MGVEPCSGHGCYCACLLLEAERGGAGRNTLAAPFLPPGASHWLSQLETTGVWETQPVGVSLLPQHAKQGNGGGGLEWTLGQTGLGLALLPYLCIHFLWRLKYIPQTWCLTQQQFILLQSGGQRFSKARAPFRALGEIPPLSLSAAGGSRRSLPVAAPL